MRRKVVIIRISTFTLSQPSRNNYASSTVVGKISPAELGAKNFLKHTFSITPQLGGIKLPQVFSQIIQHRKGCLWNLKPFNRCCLNWG